MTRREEIQADIAEAIRDAMQPYIREPITPETREQIVELCIATLTPLLKEVEQPQYVVEVDGIKSGVVRIRLLNPPEFVLLPTQVEGLCRNTESGTT